MRPQGRLSPGNRASLCFTKRTRRSGERAQGQKHGGHESEKADLLMLCSVCQLPQNCFLVVRLLEISDCFIMIFS